MYKLQVIYGDITKSTTKYISHQINCKSTSAKGLCKQLVKLFPCSDVYSTGTKRIPGTILVRGNGA